MPCGYYTSGPNECMVASGCCHSKNTFVIGGKVFIWPGCQRIQKISLNIITCEIITRKVYTQQGVPVSITATAQVKVSNKYENLKVACQLFLGMNTLNQPQFRKQPDAWDTWTEERQEQHLAQLDSQTSTSPTIQSCATQTLEGHQRAIMATMTVEEIYMDRLKFSAGVQKAAAADLALMGISIVSYTIKDVRDDVGYLHAIGERRTAEVIRDARIGEEEAKKLAAVAEFEAKMQTFKEVFEKKTMESEAERNFRIENAGYNMEIQTKKAIENLAIPLQEAKTTQEITEEKLHVEVVKKSKDIGIAEAEILRKDRDLKATTEKAALAEKKKKEMLAEAKAFEVTKKAEGTATAIHVKGVAKAEAIAAVGQAEAEAMNKRALAYQGYKGAAMVDVVLQRLPQIAAEIATPMSKVETLTMVAGENGEVGAARLTGEVLDIMGSIPDIVQKLTGVDITEAISRASRA
eukprot:m.436498 g.436498  ORF g.436498 m.436498 type:complete len:464 (+) comp17983_c0_seq1:175-1566(+)